jgi:hypothetical protein
MIKRILKIVGFIILQAILIFSLIYMIVDIVTFIQNQ